MLSASLISTVLGTKLPGPGAIYVSQSLRFKAPVRAGDTVTARVVVTEILPEKRRAVMQTLCSVGSTVVVEGEAVVMVPTRG
jgi:3-hydroxybutyryl-CoA dehydratase